MRSSEAAGWKDLVRELGQALIDLLRAEAEALRTELGRSGRRLAVAAGLLVGASFLLFWTVGVLTAAVVALLSLWLPVWGSALIVALGSSAVAALIGWAGWARIRTLESPALTVRRRLEDHLEWWDRRLLPGETKEERKLEEGG